MKYLPCHTAPTKLPTFIAACFFALALAFTQTSAFAQSWSGATDSAWGVGGNWSPSGVPATNVALTFGTASGYTVDLGGVSRVVGDMTFQNGANYTLQNGTLTLASGVGINTTAAGTTIINANLDVTSSQTATIAGNITLNGVITATNLNVASAGQTVTISGSAQNAISGSFSILGGTVIVDKSAGTSLAQQRAIGSNLIFSSASGKLVYTNQAGSLGRITLQRDGIIEAAQGFSMTGTGSGNYIQFGPGYKLTLDTHSATANITTWVGLSGTNTSGNAELETLSNVDFNQDARGIRNVANGNAGPAVLSFIKSGAGTLTYASTVTNIYTGSTTLKGGTLRMGSITQLGGSDNNATNLVFSGGTLEYTGATDSSGRGFTVSSGTSTIAVTNAASALEFSGTLTGAGELRKTGAGTLVLSGNGSALSGKVLVTAGTLDLNTTSGSALGGTTNVSVASGATLLLSKSDQVNNAAKVTLSGGTIKRASGVSETFSDLNLTTASTLDYGSGTAGTLTFGTYTPGSLLTVNNFFKDNKLVFSSNIGSGINDTNYFKFSSAFTTNWNGSTFTITAIPEPSSCAAAAGLIGLMLWPALRRRFKHAAP